MRAMTDFFWTLTGLLILIAIILSLIGLILWIIIKIIQFIEPEISHYVKQWKNRK